MKAEHCAAPASLTGQAKGRGAGSGSLSKKLEETNRAIDKRLPTAQEPERVIVCIEVLPSVELRVLYEVLTLAPSPSMIDVETCIPERRTLLLRCLYHDLRRPTVLLYLIFLLG